MTQTPTSTAPDTDRLARLEQLAQRMDSLFNIPGTRIRVGLDSILGLVPGVGDALSAAPALYIVSQAHRMGVPTGTKLRMGGNIAIDAIIGAIPLIGDIFDVGYKGNLRNVALIRRHLERAHGPLPSATDRARPRGGVSDPETTD